MEKFNSLLKNGFWNPIVGGILGQGLDGGQASNQGL